MVEEVTRNNHRFYKIYSGLMLTLIMLLLAALLVVVIVGAIKINQTARSLDKDLSNLNQQLQSVKTNLQAPSGLPSGLPSNLNIR